MLDYAEPITHVATGVGGVLVALIGNWWYRRSRKDDTLADAQARFRRDLMQRVRDVSVALATCQERAEKLADENTELRLENGRLHMDNETLRAEIDALKNDRSNQL